MQLTLTEKTYARSAAIFSGLSDAEFDRALNAASCKPLAADAFFFMEEDPADAAFVLIEGKVKLAQVTVHGQQVILGYLTPGRVYGIIAVLKRMTYPVSAQAVGKCRALVWDRNTLNQLMEASPRIALNAMRIMAGQIREFQNRVRELSTQQVEQRIARAVLRLARQSGRRIDVGVVIDLPLSRQDLAEMTGTTMYTVSRVLKEWAKRGIVESRRQQVTILAPHGLVVIAEGIPSVEGLGKVDDDICDI
ncbi:MAG: Crp/Fnr family transcriptional regulator [Anaerolineae bacterium]|nr:Crp/Fnr family transcriptional regulator [Anaerolineae bacterium]